MKHVNVVDFGVADIQEIYGTISTGKEANVYHSVGGDTLEELSRTKRLPQRGGAAHSSTRVRQQLRDEQQQNTDLLDAQLVKVAQEKRLQRAAQQQASASSDQEPEPEPEPARQKTAGAVQKLDAADRARAFLEGTVKHVQMKPEGDHIGADGNSRADTREVAEIAIKIFKTSILVFKDRDKYVTGDHRFNGGYSKHNPRKMVKAWAEKEFRNLSRLHDCAIRCPRPRMLRNHVLLMDFIGRGGVAAPRLKDCEMDTEAAHVAYLECVRMMWRMYNEARLVHGDLSEYNILYWEGKLVFIDVSQSVEHDHPAAFDFLRKDCENICAFFHKKGCLSVMTLRELFDFITDTAITVENYEDYLEKMMKLCSERPAPTARQMVADAVFKTAFIPTKLADINHYERDLAKAGHVNQRARVTAKTAAYDDLLGVDDDNFMDRAEAAREDDAFMYRKVIGVNPEVNVNAARLVPEILAKDEDEEDEVSDGDGENDFDEEQQDEGGGGGLEDFEFEGAVYSQDTLGNMLKRDAESGELVAATKKEHKKVVKAMNAQRRVKKGEEGRGKKVKKRKKALSKRHG